MSAYAVSFLHYIMFLTVVLCDLVCDTCSFYLSDWILTIMIVGACRLHFYVNKKIVCAAKILQ